jgi:hypothetical protein
MGDGRRWRHLIRRKLSREDPRADNADEAALRELLSRVHAHSPPLIPIVRINRQKNLGLQCGVTLVTLATADSCREI